MRKQSASGPSSDRVYSSSEEKRHKSAGNVYSENESGYKSESDFRCVSDYKSESEFQSEAPKAEDDGKGNRALKIENKKNKHGNSTKKTEKQETSEVKDKDRKNKDKDNEVKDTDKMIEKDKVHGTGEDKDDGIENDVEDDDEGGDTWL